MAKPSQQIKVIADIAKNRLQITLNGVLLKKDIDNIYTDIRFAVADLQPGFDVITDFSQCKVGYISGIGGFKKIMTYLTDNKAGRVIRIVPARGVIYKQIMNITAAISGYKPIYVKSLEEAEQILTQAS